MIFSRTTTTPAAIKAGSPRKQPGPDLVFLWGE
jgi:hypothetical protein